MANRSPVSPYRGFLPSFFISSIMFSVSVAPDVTRVPIPRNGLRSVAPTWAVSWPRAPATSSPKERSSIFSASLALLNASPVIVVVCRTVSPGVSGTSMPVSRKTFNRPCIRRALGDIISPIVGGSCSSGDISINPANASLMVSIPSSAEPPNPIKSATGARIKRLTGSLNIMSVFSLNDFLWRSSMRDRPATSSLAIFALGGLLRKSCVAG